MRTTLAALGCAGALALAACNPYDPNLPARPFKCGASEPVCPEGYTCDGVDCVQITEGPDAAPPELDARCLDLAEPNDQLNQATLTPVYAQFDQVVLEGITVCPMEDVDYFRVTQPTVCGGTSNPPCPNLDVLVTYTDVIPALQIQSATGATLTFGGLPNPPIPSTVKAVLNNVAQGQYYIVIGAMDATVPNYQLTIDGTRQ